MECQKPEDWQSKLSPRTSPKPRTRSLSPRPGVEDYITISYFQTPLRDNPTENTHVVLTVGGPPTGPIGPIRYATLNKIDIVGYYMMCFGDFVERLVFLER
jgi:hypothetical protein